VSVEGWAIIGAIFGYFLLEVLKSNYDKKSAQSESADAREEAKKAQLEASKHQADAEAGKVKAEYEKRKALSLSQRIRILLGHARESSKRGGGENK